MMRLLLRSSSGKDRPDVVSLNSYRGTKQLTTNDDPTMDTLLESFIKDLLEAKRTSMMNNIKSRQYHEQVVQGYQIINQLVKKDYAGTRYDAVNLANEMNRSSTSVKLVHARAFRGRTKIEDTIRSYKIVRGSDPLKDGSALEGVSSSDNYIMSMLEPKSSIIKTDPEYQRFVLKTVGQDWMKSLHRLDPRQQILVFFNDMAKLGLDTDLAKTANVLSAGESNILRMFYRSSAFSVWRPTSNEAIRKMIAGEGTGKGLDIKGKSAQKGRLSGFVPFLQIHEEDHKNKVSFIKRGERVRVYMSSEKNRDEVIQELRAVTEEVGCALERAREAMRETADKNVLEEALDVLTTYDLEDKNVHLLNDFAPNCYGVCVEERVLWEMFVMRKDISRPDGSEHDTGRPSIPAFQDMNFGALRKKNHLENEPKAVLWQNNKEDPLSGRDLLMAYEEDGNVKPVVSDFDCFLVGTHGVSYTEPLPQKQIELMKWCIDEIETILQRRDKNTPDQKSWTSQWLDVLKNAHATNKEGFKQEMPRYGFGDPKSISVVEMAVDRLKDTGAVRHGPECFNYYFPQDPDEKYLVICDALDGPVPWKYVDLDELQDFLIGKIDQDFTFPLNPKWVLVDQGWKRVYDCLTMSDNKHVKQSLDMWFPPESGLRDRIDSISKQYGANMKRERVNQYIDNSAERDLAFYQFEMFVNPDGIGEGRKTRSLGRFGEGSCFGDG